MATKVQLQAECLALRASNAALSAECEALSIRVANAVVAYKALRDQLSTNLVTVQPDQRERNEKYPEVDYRGRHFRMSGRVKCYAPSA